MTNEPTKLSDIDPVETREWLEALQAVEQLEGTERARFLVNQLLANVQQEDLALPMLGTATAYKNTIAVQDEAKFPGDLTLEEKLNAIIRWNAIAMVVRAGKTAKEVGGHIASYASASTLYEVGFNHFFHTSSAEHPGDLVFIQGHSSPGIYARAFLEGRLTKQQLENFRQEVDGNGISSYPHPWLMPDFWQFATVSMGLAPLQGIYQARFLRYLENRNLLKTAGRKVWVFCGDGEMDEPESMGCISIAARERLDNLVFVVNCNLQRLDGPVRGNGSIVRELENIFRGAGWNVIKVLWGSIWDSLFAADSEGILLKRMAECVDGEYQNYNSKDGAYVRENFFGKYPELQALVADMSDDQLNQLFRSGLGGHDYRKVFAAYQAALQHQGQPTIILAQTLKGYGMGITGEGHNTTHQQKKMSAEELKFFCKRFAIPLDDAQAEQAEYYLPAKNSSEIKYLKERRQALGGSFPIRRTSSNKLNVPPLNAFASQLESTEDREISTTMALVRVLNTLIKDKEIGKRIVPIVPDECRTFGMEGMFRQFGIYSPVGQLYVPMDREQIMYYREAQDGQILEEGLNEAGAFSSWLAAATSYSTNDYSMVPFYIYYSMFGFQRIGDLAWAAGDMRARGFLIGATAGRTTLAGEGLQHDDGQSHIQSAIIPNCISYDPTYSYELAVIIQDGMRRMYQEQESIFYYITVMNENYSHPAMPKDAEQGIIKGMYLLKEANSKNKLKVQLLGCGTILREVEAAAELLETDFGVLANVWSVTSFTELRREGLDAQRWNMLHPSAKQPRISYVEECFKKHTGPVIAASDYMKLFADQIRQFIPSSYTVLGTDGFGRSDTREKLRRFFEVNRYYIVIATLKALADEGSLPASKVDEAIKKYSIDPEKPNPQSI